jgi:hypothetical protein
MPYKDPQQARAYKKAWLEFKRRMKGFVRDRVLVLVLNHQRDDGALWPYKLSDVVLLEEVLGKPHDNRFLRARFGVRLDELHLIAKACKAAGITLVFDPCLDMGFVDDAPESAWVKMRGRAT